MSRTDDFDADVAWKFLALVMAVTMEATIRALQDLDCWLEDDMVSESDVQALYAKYVVIIKYGSDAGANYGDSSVSFMKHCLSEFQLWAMLQTGDLTSTPLRECDMSKPMRLKATSRAEKSKREIGFFGYAGVKRNRRYDLE